MKGSKYQTLQTASQNHRIGDMIVTKPAGDKYLTGHDIAFSKCPRCHENDKMYDKHTETFYCNKCHEYWKLNGK